VSHGSDLTLRDILAGGKGALPRLKAQSFMKNHFLFQAVTCLVFWILMAVGSIARPAIVVIDPGHGGSDRGGIPGQRLAEKVFTLDTGKRLARILRANGGIEVVMTRDDDRFVSLAERTNIANRYRGRNAVFVSIHYNAALREGAYGIETYYNNNRAYRLAALVHPRVVQAMDTISRGIRQRRYRVLRNNRLPAILVECGFLTNHLEGERASDPNYRQRIALAMASAILRYD
jgi:N-acetylmuramoyl-L-alanine amidase